MWLQIEHRLEFSYDGWVSESHLELRIEPRSTRAQTLRSFWIAVGPPTRVHRYLDWNGNHVHHFGIHDFHQRIEILARSLVETHPEWNSFAALGDLSARPEELAELHDWIRLGGPVSRSPGLDALAREVPVPETAPLAAQVEQIGRFVHQRFRYVQDVTDWRSTSDHLIETGAGVCQDFAHVMLALLRLRGIPCRYVSGYLHLGTQAPAQSHAWVEVHAGPHGWIGYDPTHAQIPDAQYVIVATGRHYDDVPPNRGVYRGHAHETLHADVHTREAAPTDVAALHEETAAIDLPVFREIPLVVPKAGAGAAEQAPQEQQQSQQQ